VFVHNEVPFVEFDQRALLLHLLEHALLRHFQDVGDLHVDLRKQRVVVKHARKLLAALKAGRVCADPPHFVPISQEGFVPSQVGNRLLLWTQTHLEVILLLDNAGVRANDQSPDLYVEFVSLDQQGILHKLLDHLAVQLECIDDCLTVVSDPNVSCLVLQDEQVFAAVVVLSLLNVFDVLVHAFVLVAHDGCFHIGVLVVKTGQTEVLHFLPLYGGRHLESAAVPAQNAQVELEVHKIHELLLVFDVASESDYLVELTRERLDLLDVVMQVQVRLTLHRHMLHHLRGTLDRTDVVLVYLVVEEIPLAFRVVQHEGLHQELFQEVFVLCTVGLKDRVEDGFVEVVSVL